MDGKFLFFLKFTDLGDLNKVMVSYFASASQIGNSSSLEGRAWHSTAALMDGKISSVLLLGGLFMTSSRTSLSAISFVFLGRIKR